MVHRNRWFTELNSMVDLYHGELLVISRWYILTCVSTRFNGFQWFILVCLHIHRMEIYHKQDVFFISKMVFSNGNFYGFFFSMIGLFFNFCISKKDISGLTLRCPQTSWLGTTGTQWSFIAGKSSTMEGIPPYHHHSWWLIYVRTSIHIYIYTYIYI